ncbi:MAG TPA: hypothetical protein PLP34_08970, partial [Chitinophagaceae bacterium]|nr:hypothetical protein [Chitinophagaceae bacterium]
MKWNFLLALFLFVAAGNSHAMPMNDTSTYFIHHIIFHGNQITRPQIINREMTLRTGDRIPKNKLEEELDRNSR